MSAAIGRFLTSEGVRRRVPAAASIAANVLFSDDAQRHTKPRDIAKARAEEVTSLATDDTRAAMWVWDKLAGIRAVDVPLYDRLETTARKTFTFLASKAPAPPPPGLVSRPWTPSDAEVSSFLRYVAAAPDPGTRLMDELEGGALTAETVEAAKVLAPATFEYVRNTIVSQIPELRITLSFARQNLLGLLFDVPVHPSQEPMAFSGLQASFAAQHAEEQQAQGGISKDDLGSVRLKMDTASLETQGQRLTTTTSMRG